MGNEIAQYLSRTFHFSTQNDTVEAMAMGRELFEAGRSLGAPAAELAPPRKDMKVLDVSRSDFEGTLFNLITLRNFPGKKRVVFSGRMAIAKAMTNTLLKEQEKHVELGSASPAPEGK